MLHLDWSYFEHNIALMSSAAQWRRNVRVGDRAARDHLPRAGPHASRQLHCQAQNVDGETHNKDRQIQNRLSLMIIINERNITI